MKKLYLKSAIIASMLMALSEIAYSATSSTEAFSKMQRLKEQGKVPAYVLEQGAYKYVEGVHTAHVQGKNVRMRSQPLNNARVITQLTYVDLEYLGEWTHPKNGEKWICVKRKTSDEIGWIYAQYIELLKENTPKNTKIQTTSKKDKSCTEDPCGALGGLLLISPILYFFNWISEQKGKNNVNNQEAIDTIDIISPYYKHYFKWETFGPDEAFYEVMRTAPLLDVLEVLKHIDFNQTDGLWWVLQTDKAALKNPHMFVYTEVSNYLSQFLTSHKFGD